MTSKKNNQPSRYNDVTVIDYKEKPKEISVENDNKDYDVFRVSDRYCGRIMAE